MTIHKRALDAMYACKKESIQAHCKEYLRYWQAACRHKNEQFKQKVEGL